MDVRSELARITGLGYSVFPVVRKTKKPLTARGFKDATTDMAQVDRWIKMHGDCNWAIRVPSNAVVVDVDTLDGGDANMWPRDPEMAISLADCGAISLTPRGGRHHWFRQPIPGKWRSTAGKLAAKVDTRCDDGYVLIPPSTTRDGDYRWLDGMELNGPPDDLPEPPEWLTAQLNANPGRGQNHSGGVSPGVLPPVDCIIVFTHDSETFANTNPYWHGRALELLVACGGQYSHEIDDVMYFVRPGKDPREGHGATWNHPASRHGVTKSSGVRLGYPRLTVFTGNWPPFEEKHSYSPHDILKLLTSKEEWAEVESEIRQDHHEYWHACDPDNFLRWAPEDNGGGEEDVVAESEPAFTPSGAGPHKAEEVDLSRTLKNSGDGLPNDFPGFFKATIDKNPGTILPMICDAIRRKEWMEQPLFRISGALAVMAAITGRKVVTTCGLMTNCYFLNVAPTGEGKDVARKMVSYLIEATEPPPPDCLPKDGGTGESKDPVKEQKKRMGIMNLPHSDTATLKALEEQPARLAVVDEFGAIMLAAKKSPSSHVHRLVILATGLFTHGRAPYYPPRYADTTKNFELDAPCLSIFGFTVERSLGESLDSAAVEGGMVPRCLLFHGNVEAPILEAEDDYLLTTKQLDEKKEREEKLLEAIKAWRIWEPMNDEGVMTWRISHQEEHIDDDCIDAFKDIFGYYTDVPATAAKLFSLFRLRWLEIKRHGQRTGQVEYLAATRGLELAKKVAVLVSANRVGPPPRPSIKQDISTYAKAYQQWEESAIINWRDALAACILVDYCLAGMTRFVRFNTSDGPTSRAANAILAYFKKHPETVITKSEICQGVRSVDCKTLRQNALNHLLENGEIKQSQCTKGYIYIS